MPSPRNQPHKRRSRLSPEVAAILAKSVTIIEKVPIADILPYRLNPRDNEQAVPAVEKAIRKFGFKIPIVLDSGNVIVAGHTRVEAATRIGLPWVPAVRADDLSDDELRAFRLVDNKVAENAAWDFELLASEVHALQDDGFDLSGYGWTEENLDCLSDIMNEDAAAGDDALDTLEHESRQRRREQRAPNRVRFVCGDTVFFVPADVYRNWVNALRSDCGFDEDGIVDELRRRLEITDFED